MYTCVQQSETTNVNQFCVGLFFGRKSNPYRLLVALTNHTQPYRPGYLPPPPLPGRAVVFSGYLYQDDGETSKCSDDFSGGV